MRKKLNIIVYGIGNNWHCYKERINQDYHVVALMDRKFKQSAGIREKITCLIPNRENLQKVKWDKILVVPGGSIRLEIVRFLLSIGVHPDDIVIYMPEASRGWQKALIKVTDFGMRAFFGNLVFDIMHSTDAVILSEIYEHLDYGISLGKEKIRVLDIGMNVGLASIFFAGMQNVIDVYGFEPFRPTFEEALHNFALNIDDVRRKIHPQCIGLSNRDTVLHLAYNEDFPGDMGQFVQQDPNGIPMHLAKASSMIAPLLRDGTEEKIVCKIDVEGSEYEILQDLSESDLLCKIDYIIMETHMGKEAIAKRILTDNNFICFSNNEAAGLGMIRAARVK